MTFLEKALEMETDKSLTKEDIIHNFCPSGYGLEEDKCNLVDRKGCKKCWNREMPNTEATEEPFIDFKGELDTAYNKGLKDAWELAKEVWAMSFLEREDAFGYEKFIDVLEDYTPQEALAKLKAYEEAQEIKVGDIVRYGEETEFVVTFYNGEIAQGIVGNGEVLSCSKEYLTKTGKHIDISSIIEQIGE